MKTFYFVVLLCLILSHVVKANIYLVTNTYVSGSGSLGNAIVLANTQAGKDSIYFFIPSQTVAGRTITISNDSLLPHVQDTVVIDATTQPYGGHFGNSSAKIQITSADTATVGLVIDASAPNSEIYGFFINHFSNGLILQADGFVLGANLNGNVISHCESVCLTISKVVEGSVVATFIGVDTSGSNITSPHATGIFIDSSKKITVGGKQPKGRNIISGCFVGIKISDSRYITIQDNYIGTDYLGTVAVSNTTGVLATQLNDENKNIIIGGDSAKYSNIISGNLQRGLDLDLSSASIQFNMIGTDLTGTLHLGNGSYGIYFRESAHDILVGGVNGGVANVIAYNEAEAVVLENQGTENISIRGNRIFCNSQSSGEGGIVLNGGNQSANAPTIAIVTSNFIAGTCHPNAEVDIYSADSCNTCEGANYLSTVVADSNGIFSDTILISGKVTATVSDTSGNTSEFAVCKDSSNTSCVFATFKKSKNKICSNETIDFTDQSITIPGSNITSWNWHFGDGQTSAVPNPVITFPQSGTWDATLIVTNSAGCTDTLVDSITVKEGAVANFFTDEDVCLGQPTHFTDVSVALGSSYIVSWYWDLGDGTQSTFTDFLHYYALPGEYLVKLTIVNNSNCDNSFTDTVGVHPLPQAAFTATSDVCSIIPVEFTDNSFAAGGSTLTSWLWEFGDGDTSSAENPSHLFTVSGSYLVTLIVTDNFGCSDTTVQGVTILAGAVADFTWTTNGNTVSFVNTSTYNANATMLWTFGDGNSSLLITPSHTYNSTGVFEVCLVVTDVVCIMSDTICQTILITGIDGVNENSGISVSPNPATHLVRVSNLPISSSIKISLFNFLGKEILPQKILKRTSDEFTLSLPEVSEGIYWLRVESDAGIVMRKLVISQK